MKTVQTEAPRDFAAAKTIPHDPGTEFTPAEFFKEAGTLIAVCLVLGVLMRILLG